MERNKESQIGAKKKTDKKRKKERDVENLKALERRRENDKQTNREK
jgi:hypothetical protein